MNLAGTLWGIDIADTSRDSDNSVITMRDRGGRILGRRYTSPANNDSMSVVRSMVLQANERDMSPHSIDIHDQDEFASVMRFMGARQLYDPSPVEAWNA